MINVWFNNTNLGSISGVFLTQRLAHSIPQKEVNSMKLANTDGNKFVSTNYKSREIIIEGIIGLNSRALMEGLS